MSWRLIRKYETHDTTSKTFREHTKPDWRSYELNCGHWTAGTMSNGYRAGPDDWVWCDSCTGPLLGRFHWAPRSIDRSLLMNVPTRETPQNVADAWETN